MNNSPEFEQLPGANASEAEVNEYLARMYFLQNEGSAGLQPPEVYEQEIKETLSK